jgi:hypothetical protein
MPRRLPVVAVVSVALLLVVAARLVLLPPANPRITEANFQRIKAGMRREEVEAILGRPGDYRTGPTFGLYTSGPLFIVTPATSDATPLEWRGDEVEISAWVDPDGVVLDSSRGFVLRGQVGMMEWLTWRWKHLRNEDAP